jgi:hypothetical protein
VSFEDTHAASLARQSSGMVTVSPLS